MRAERRGGEGGKGGVGGSVGLLMMIQSHQLNRLHYQGISECLQTAPLPPLAQRWPPQKHTFICSNGTTTIIKVVSEQESTVTQSYSAPTIGVLADFESLVDWRKPEKNEFLELNFSLSTVVWRSNSPSVTHSTMCFNKPAGKPTTGFLQKPVAFTDEWKRENTK